VGVGSAVARPCHVGWTRTLGSSGGEEETVPGGPDTSTDVLVQRTRRMSADAARSAAAAKAVRVGLRMPGTYSRTRRGVEDGADDRT
jgi:hypothetical protein